jgi:hypothetical protein
VAQRDRETGRVRSGVQSFGTREQRRYDIMSAFREAGLIGAAEGGGR